MTIDELIHNCHISLVVIKGETKIKAIFPGSHRDEIISRKPEIVARLQEIEAERPAPEPIVYHCERCGAVVNPATAYHQMERYGKLAVKAYYCDSCKQLLQQVGFGEHTAMAERRGARYNIEQAYKDDRDE